MKIINQISYAALTVLVLLLSACQKDIVDHPDGDDFSSDGVPKIEKITPADQLETSITQGEMGQWLAIQGDNLAQVKAILFNDVNVDLKKIYAVRRRINVAIPAEAPTKLTNTITVQTEQGEVTYPFTILFPELVVNGFENEFAAAGTDAVVTGRFFDLYGLSGESASITIDGNPLKVVEKSDTRLVFTIPEGTAEGAEVVLNSPKMKTPYRLKFRDRGVPFFASYEKSYLFGQGFLWTDQGYFTDGTQEGDPVSPIGGSFFRRRNTYGAWNWDTLIAGHFDLADANVAAHTENYNVKFEVWTPKTNPLSTGDFIFWSTQSNDKMKLRWNPASGGSSFNTNGEWRTITLDAKTWFQSNDGKNTLKTGSNDLTIVYQPQNALDADFALTNFRFVKK